jgi:hypothetical protein
VFLPWSSLHSSQAFSAWIRVGWDGVNGERRKRKEERREENREGKPFL